MSPRDRIARFSWGERALHWLLAASFLTMLATGLMMSVPAFSGLVARPVAKAAHLDAALALAAGVVLLAAVHGRRLRATLRQLDRFDRDDLAWLRRIPARLVGRRRPAPPQGRFNAGQKLNAATVGGLMVVAYVTGGLLWLGERDTTYRLAGTVKVHDAVMWLMVLLVSAHVYMAVMHHDTRESLPGMVRGSVDREWARHHHAKWVHDDEVSGPGGS